MSVAAADHSPPLHQNWLKFGVAGTLDIHNLAIGTHPLTQVNRNWMVRAIAHDCDGNGVWNYCDIVAGQPDLNNNGIPDPCEIACPPDLQPPGGDGVVSIDDLLYVIAQWGQTTGVADLNHDDIVNIDDLLAIITHWGPCP